MRNGAPDRRRVASRSNVALSDAQRREGAPVVIRERLAMRRTRATIVGRRRDVLATAAAEIGAKAVAFDAADPAAATAALPQLPGTIDVLVNAAGANTDLAADRPADELVAARRADFPPQRRAFAESRSADDRLGRADEVAALVAFVASPQASHPTEQVLHVSGGMHLGR